MEDGEMKMEDGEKKMKKEKLLNVVVKIVQNYYHLATVPSCITALTQYSNHYSSAENF